jgi:hypothetical protein
VARIRADKPEAYQSETLAEISLAAERTFKGMATIADDRGRLADKPAQINGELWSMRGSHTAPGWCAATPAATANGTCICPRGTSTRRLTGRASRACPGVPGIRLSRTPAASTRVTASLPIRGPSMNPRETLARIRETCNHPKTDSMRMQAPARVFRAARW